MFNIRKTMHQNSDSSDSDAAVEEIDTKHDSYAGCGRDDPLVGHVVVYLTKITSKVRTR